MINTSSPKDEIISSAEEFIDSLASENQGLRDDRRALLVLLLIVTAWATVF